MKELAVRALLSLIVWLVILGGSHLIGHPVIWWVAAVVAVVLVFLGEWIMEAID